MAKRLPKFDNKLAHEVYKELDDKWLGMVHMENRFRFEYTMHLPDLQLMIELMQDNYKSLNRPKNFLLDNKTKLSNFYEPFIYLHNKGKMNMEFSTESK